MRRNASSAADDIRSPAPGLGRLTLIASGRTRRCATLCSATSPLRSARRARPLVRFLFGCPFSFLILAAACMIASAPPPVPDARTLLVIATAAALQIAATALMLASMRERSFVIVTALLKTEAVQIVVFGVLFLGEAATPPLALGALSATFGVLALCAARPAGGTARRSALAADSYGLGSAALFGVSTVCYREGCWRSAAPHSSSRPRPSSFLASSCKRR